jgi:hypothetical protein
MTEILGDQAHVERVALNDVNELVAVCRHGRQRQTIPMLDLPLPRRLLANGLKRFVIGSAADTECLRSGWYTAPAPCSQTSRRCPKMNSSN